VKDKESKEPLTPAVKEEFWQKMFDAGLFSRVAGWLGNRMFISPPCTMTIEEADKTLDIICPLVAALKSK